MLAEGASGLPAELGPGPGADVQLQFDTDTSEAPRSVSSPAIHVISSDGAPRRGTSSMGLSFPLGHFGPSRGARLQSLCLRCFSFACFAMSNMLLPMILGFQMVLLDMVLYLCAPIRSTLVVFVPTQVLLLLHMVRHAQSTQAVRAGSLQWIVYSWLISAISWLMYFYVLHAETRPQEISSQDMLARINRCLYFTPVFYCILTFRTLRQLFSVTESGGRGGIFNGASRDRHEHMTLDVVLLQDMVWHVVIDFIDINYMMFMANPLEAATTTADRQTVLENQDQFERMRMAVGGFIFLALFFHQQSFPSCSVLESDKGGKEGGKSASSQHDALAASGNGSGLSSDDLGAVVADHHSSWTRGTGSSRRRTSRRQEQIADVVKARKRSAIVSIILVDLPFFIIRLYMWSMSMSNRTSSPASPQQANATISIWGGAQFDEYGGRPMLDKWLVKNILCMLLQAMQLRFVQQADLERSQSLRWWDRGGQRRGTDVGKHRLKKSMQDPQLRHIWQEMDRSKLEAAYRATGSGNLIAEMPGSSQEEEPRSGPSTPAAADDAARRAADGGRGGGSPGDGASRRRPWWCFCCCFRRRRRKSRRCCCCKLISCDCSNSVLLHAVMGLALGWLIAKVDFTQASTDLLNGLGSQTA